ncbi:MAG TPA: protein-disulfide reductase DsbD domain-containing protein, partial [Thermoanaerobaculia bacterium]|nr:protein-disulfide reductase DsbD domain-containing protein [Thermoanaerobaculia bacterium]
MTSRRHFSAFLPAALAAAVLALAAAPPAGAVASPWQENDQSRVRLVTPFDVAPAEGPIRLGLHFETAPGWHVYWKNSGDAGYPPAIDLEATPELSALELLWPAPERYELPGDLVAFGYEGEVVYPVAARIDAAGRDRITLTAEVDYLVCEVECIPYRYQLTAEQPVARPGESPVPDAATAPLLAEWGARVPEPVASVEGITSEAAIDWGDDGELPEIEVVVTGAEPASGVEPQVFFGPSDTYGTGKPRRLDEGGALRFRVPLELLAVPDEPPATLPLSWVVTGLARTGLGRGEGSGRPLAVEAAGDVPVLTTGSPMLGGVAATRLRPAQLGRVLVMAAAGGVILHLMPTLLPLLLLGLLVLRPVQASHGRLSARAALATAAGAFVGALALGGAALVAHAAGMPAAWGSQLQEPVLVALLAVAVTLVALNLWGLFPAPLRFPSAEERPGATLGGRAA